MSSLNIIVNDDVIVGRNPITNNTLILCYDVEYQESADSKPVLYRSKDLKGQALFRRLPGF